MNYMYLPASPEDGKAHQRLLDSYGIDDTRAYMTSFYPAIKEKIIKSWNRLFEVTPEKGSKVRMGTIWEIREEWIIRVAQ